VVHGFRKKIKVELSCWWLILSLAPF